MHDEMKYCNEPFINISEWLKTKFNSSEILLEEIDRNTIYQLESLWNSSTHTNQLKNLFLNNSNIIHPIDIRLQLIPFSWELLETYIINITLKKYLTILDELFNNNIKNKNKNKKLIKHFNLIKDEYYKFKLKINIYLDNQLNDIFINNIIILKSINTLLDNIMEWFTIAKMYKLDNNNNIIHVGLYHSERIINLLIKLYKYKLVSFSGINKINDANKSNISGCIDLPKNIDIELSK